MKTTLGYTLAELMVVLAIILVSSSIAAPALGRMIRDNEKNLSINQMLTMLRHTRSSAVFSQQNTTLCAGHDNCNGSNLWQHELIIFQDKNGNGRRDANEPLLRKEKLIPSYTWYWASFRRLDHAIFEANGTSRAANGTMTLCYEGSPVHQVVINLTGRARHQPANSTARCQ